ncbi:MAG: lysophospholipid acyltransferase family protein [Rhodospirillales bacterium]|nr:lysophospholipid acyltransferase family protein [Rhodospirillales bacterium]
MPAFTPCNSRIRRPPATRPPRRRASPAAEGVVVALKRLFRSDPVQRLLARLIAFYIRFVHATSRQTIHGAEIVARQLATGRPLIGCFWHGRMMLMPRFWTAPVPMRMLISRHRDGRLIARTIALLGFPTITGSSSRGGATALREIVRTLKDGDCVCVTPDGPRGPRMRAAPGLVAAARLAGVPVIPATFSTTRGRELGSWDRLLFALPFGRIVFVIGEPVEVPPDADEAALEAARATVEARLNAVTRASGGGAARKTARVWPSVAGSPAAPARRGRSCGYTRRASAKPARSSAWLRI